MARSRSNSHAHAFRDGIALKKQYGQHFLRDHAVVDDMIHAVTITPDVSIFEIGCGDGFLTQALLNTKTPRVWVFEIDPEWATHVRNIYPDQRLTIFQEDIMTVDLTARLAPHAPWVLLANLPYQLTFPILYLLQKNKHLLQEGVVMIQEEVAQKLVKTGGRDYGYTSLFFQHHFTMRLLTHIPPEAFYPPPKVHSRLLYFKPRVDAPEIPDEEQFWKFIKVCFAQPRRTLQNNLAGSHYREVLPQGTKWDALRAQQMNMADFLELWNMIRAAQ